MGCAGAGAIDVRVDSIDASVRYAYRNGAGFGRTDRLVSVIKVEHLGVSRTPNASVGSRANKRSWRLEHYRHAILGCDQFIECSVLYHDNIARGCCGNSRTDRFELQISAHSYSRSVDALQIADEHSIDQLIGAYIVPAKRNGWVLRRVPNLDDARGSVASGMSNSGYTVRLPNLAGIGFD